MCNSGWKDVTLNEVLDVDIEQGIEVKIVYDRRINPNEKLNLKFSNTASDSHDLTVSLRDGRCAFEGCPIGTLNMNTVQIGIAFILKIYRNDDKLMVDLNGSKNVEINMNTQGYSTCATFWGEDENYRFRFIFVSANLEAQFRIEAADEEDKNEG